MLNPRTLIIEVVPQTQRRWTPVIGSETLALLERLPIPEESRYLVRDEAVALLARCAPPTHAGIETCLAIGYIQSGKTMSFTTLTALARDNEYQIVIVITGTSIPLFDRGCPVHS